MKQEAPYWIKGDSLCVIDGWCWGVSRAGATVCVGKVEDLKEDKK